MNKPSLTSYRFNVDSELQLRSLATSAKQIFMFFRLLVSFLGSSSKVNRGKKTETTFLPKQTV